MDYDVVENSDESPWSYYGQDRLFKFGRKGIMVSQDGSKTIVKLPEAYRRYDMSSVSSRLMSTASVRGFSDHLNSISDTFESLSEDFGISLGQFEPIAYSNKALRADSGSAGLSTPLRIHSATTSSQSATVTGNEDSTLWGNLMVILSIIYAIFLVTVGVVISVADLIVPETNIGKIFSIYLLLLGLSWYIFLHLDILRHNECMKKQQQNPKLPRLCSGVESANYTFGSGRHSGSFFLKIGAAGFCFGHLIHSGLMLGRQILHFTSSDHILREECADATALFLYLLIPVNSFYQLYILFKYSNVMINRWKQLARFALMHSMGTSLFFWFSMILTETMHGLQHKIIQEHGDHSQTAHALTQRPLVMNLTGDFFVSLMGMWNGTALNLDRCAAGGSNFSALILHVSPYLYPFSIEYSILVVGIWFIMWQNIGKSETSTSWSGGNGVPEKSVRNQLIIHVDCHSANRGLFAGLLVLVSTVVSIIIFFLAFSEDGHNSTTAIWVNLVSESTLLVLMTVAAVLACSQLSHLDVNRNPVSLLDDLLLFMCIPCFFLYGIFSIVPAIAYSNYMAIFVIILQVMQVIVQTPFIIDGLRRCSNSIELQESKPGRELVTFLIVCNIALWIIETLEIKSYETNGDRIHFYGHPLWTFLSHATLPLTLFYRFHSSACLVDIWKSAYDDGRN